MYKILVIDDEREIVSLIKDALEIEGYDVITAYDGSEALSKIENNPDLILLDIMMPNIDGYNFCRKVREEIQCPILFLSAKQDELDKIKAFSVGGDDYITKPFSLKELRARVAAHLRREERHNKNNIAESKMNFGCLSLDCSKHKITIKDVFINLTKKEFEIVELLAMNSGQIFSKERIYELLWGYDAEGDSNTIAEHVKNIRAKFKDVDSDNEYISTVWGVGYKWEKVK